MYNINSSYVRHMARREKNKYVSKEFRTSKLSKIMMFQTWQDVLGQYDYLKTMRTMSVYFPKLRRRQKGLVNCRTVRYGNL